MVLEPLISVIADLNRLNESLHLSHVITRLYLCPVFSASRSASCLYAMVVEGPILPEAEKTRGVNEPCSTSLIRWSYALLFSRSCRLKTVLSAEVCLEDAKGLKTLPSKNASCCGFQNPLHLMSTRLSSWMFAESPCIISPLSGCSAGSLSVEVLP